MGVTANAIPHHLVDMCGCLHVADISVDMLGYYADVEGIPEYINMLEDDQYSPDVRKPPIHNAQLVRIATKAIIIFNKFPCAAEEWEGLVPATKTWTL